MNTITHQRLMIAVIIFWCLYGIIIIRLGWIQVIEVDFFTHLLDQQRYVTIDILPQRAPIIDRTGRVLAYNQEVPSIFVEPHLASSHTKHFVQTYFPDAYQTMIDRGGRKFLWLDRSINDECFQRVVTQGTAGIHVMYEPQRIYPFLECSHVLGFTDRDNKGIAGIEQQYTQELAGSASSVVVERDARSTQATIAKTVSTVGKQGSCVYTTLDSRLQWDTYKLLCDTVEQLQATLGSAVVMDPYSGDVVVMATYPGFDPHKRIDEAMVSMKNVPVTECYEPGSVMKIFTALAAFEEQVVTYDEPINCEGKRCLINRFPVENWKPMGVLPFHDVMRYSSNVGIAKVAQRLGPKLYDHLYRLGFGKKTALEFPGQRSGQLNHPKLWSRSSPLVMSFGYEETVTLLQLARATSIIANGGIDVQPRLVLNPAQHQQPSVRLYQEKSVTQVKDILALIGSGYPISGCRVMGKTGTSRVLKDGVYSPNDHNYAFTGIVEYENKSWVIVTFIQEPKIKGLLASQVAAPLFQKIGSRLVTHHLYHG